MKNARRGGTDSELRKEKKNGIYDWPEDYQKDEDVRSFMMQQVSIYQSNNYQYMNIMAQEHNKEVIAFPLNCYLSSSLEPIWTMLKNTKMHMIDIQEAEFSLSVMIEAYPSNVFSVWLYIACFKDQLNEADDL